MEERGSAGSSEERCIQRVGRSSESLPSFVLFASIFLEIKMIFRARTHLRLISH